jgi:hypothetical protein
MSDNTHDHTDTERQVARRLYDPEEDSDLTTVIVYALADARGVSPVELKSPTLYECVDAESLETTLFGENGGATSRQGSGTVKFQYAEYVVTVTSDGWVEVYESSSTDVADELERS